MSQNAKQTAQAALSYLDSFEVGYGSGASPSNVQFGNDFATECVNQITLKINNNPGFTVEQINNEFSKLLKVTQKLNDSEFAFGVFLFKTTLKNHLELKVPAVKEFFSEKNIKEQVNGFYNIEMGNIGGRSRYDITSEILKEGTSKKLKM